MKLIANYYNNRPNVALEVIEFKKLYGKEIVRLQHIDTGEYFAVGIREYRNIKRFAKVYGKCSRM